MKKILLMAALMAFTVTTFDTSAIAAPKHRVDADGALRIPLGDWADATGMLGLGAMFRYEFLVNPQLTVTGRIGYIYGMPKSENSIDFSTSEIPILAGIKWYFKGYKSMKRAGLYGAAELGMFHITVKTDAEGSKDESETEFGATIGAGYEMGALDFRGAFLMPNLSGDMKNKENEDFMPFGVLFTVGYTFASF
jgi:hypothetical protein